MTTTCENGIHHIDGPPIAGFAIAEFPDGSGNRVEIRYRVIAFHAPTELLVRESWKKLLNAIESELQDLIPIQDNPHFAHPIIWWRRRPEFTQESEHWVFSVRFATSPPLPELFWEKWEKPDGGAIRSVEELFHG